MNILDIIFSVIALYLLLRGIVRGLIIEVASLAGVILGFYLANQYYQDLTPFMENFITNRGWADVASYLVIFILTFFVVTVAAIGLRKLISVTFAGWLDHLAGSVVGLAKGVLVCCIILMVLTRFFPEADFVKESTLAPKLSGVSEYLKQFVPEDMPSLLRHGNTTNATIPSNSTGPY